MTKPTNGCVPSEDSDQPGHPLSLIRIFAVRMKKAWVLSYPLNAKRLSGLSLHWAHMPLCCFCHEVFFFFLYFSTKTCCEYSLKRLCKVLVMGTHNILFFFFFFFEDENIYCRYSLGASDEYPQLMFIFFFLLFIHYENTPIQIYRKIHLQKLKIFR